MDLPTGTVTFLFTDIQGSTPLWESQPEQMGEALQVHNEILRGVIEAHRGVVFKSVGDAFQAAFPTAPQALQAAIEGQRALQAAPWNELGELKVRMGLHTGEAELDPGGDEYAVSHTKNRAARIMSAAYGGQVLLSTETKELCDHHFSVNVNFKDLGVHHFKGMEIIERLYQACAPGLELEFPSLSTTITHPNNLPLELTSFIGREQEIETVCSLLSSNRLVTLTGSGGVGKTRLSIQVAGAMLDAFPDGVWYIELAPVSDPELVAQTTAGVLGLREEPTRPILETLVSFLSKRKLLLVIDNCEHLLEACARLVDVLLRAAPDIKLLTSSREAFGITGEVAYHVPSLAIPDLHQIPSPESLQAYDAVRLFVERGHKVLPDFQVNAHNARSVAAICRRLDGIPLALELAAARLGMLTTEQLTARLDHAFRLLTGGSRTALPRQQTLRATIDWSYQMLNDPERQLLQRMAVFAGGAPLEGIEAACSGEGLEQDFILDLLSGLVSKSLIEVERQQGLETRYRLLETVRQYARERLNDSGEIERVRDRHLEYYVRLCEEAYPHIHGAGRLGWTSRLKREYDNIREAMEWAFQDAALAEQGLRIATALIDRFWHPLGFDKEKMLWLKAGLQAASDRIPALLKANVLFGLEEFDECIRLCRQIGLEADGVLSKALADRFWRITDFEQARTRTEEAVQVARRMGSAGAWELGEALFFYAAHLSHMHPEDDYDDQALAAAQESLEIVRAGDRWTVGGYWVIGTIQDFRGNAELARQAFSSPLPVFSEVGDIVGIIFTLYWLVWHHRRCAQFDQARAYCRQLFETANSSAVENYYKMFVFSSGMLLVSSVNASQAGLDVEICLNAVRLLAAVSDYIFDDHRETWYRRHRRLDLREIDHLRGQMGEEAFSRAWKEGETMTLEQAVELARKEIDE